MIGIALIEIVVLTFQFDQICICDLAKCIVQSKEDYNLLEKLSVEEIVTLLRKIGYSLVTSSHFTQRRKKKSMKEASKKITKFVSEKCGCILFSTVIMT